MYNEFPTSQPGPSNSSAPFSLNTSDPRQCGNTRENALGESCTDLHTLNPIGAGHVTYSAAASDYQQHVTNTSTTTSSFSANSYAGRTTLQDPASQLIETGQNAGANTSIPTSRKYWDTALTIFLQEAGLTQALRGLELDMIVLNPDWEKDRIPAALKKLVEGLTSSMENTEGDNQEQVKNNNERSLDGRKLDYVHFTPGVEPRAPSTITRSISRFLAQNRSRNDASNRQEFLLSRAEKRRKLDEAGSFEEGVIASCARTDAKTQNRDLQMKFDVAKNEGGPLRKTVSTNANSEAPEAASGKTGKIKIEDADDMKREEDISAERYPGLDERLRNIEEHIAVRYVPSPPRSLLDRLKFIEDHLIHLETDYPPWAALHFNQPRRGWPPPPRPTPIIVPSHLTSSAPNPSFTTPPTDHPFVAPSTSPAESTPGTPGLSAKAKGKQAVRRDQSSLHRAVMERLEVQRAMNDLAGQSRQ